MCGWLRVVRIVVVENTHHEPTAFYYVPPSACHSETQTTPCRESRPLLTRIIAIPLALISSGVPKEATRQRISAVQGANLLSPSTHYIKHTI